MSNNSEFVVKVIAEDSYSELEENSQKVIDDLVKQGYIPIMLEHANPFYFKKITVVIIFKRVRVD